MSNTNFSLLNAHGLNLQAVFDIATLSHELIAPAPELRRYRRLLLAGHGGKAMWTALQASEFRDRPDPVDSFSADEVIHWLAETCPGANYEIIYPTPDYTAPLQQLGKLAGWHHDSPFRIGINNRWGTWFAYRVAVLVDADLPITEPEDWGSPCDDCTGKPCIATCPAGAVSDKERMLERCMDYRLTESSNCAHQCLSRLACPIGREHRYSPEQMRYHYEQSLQTIRHWRK